MNELEQKALELFDRLDSLATQYTPDVVEAAVTAVSVTAIGRIAEGFIGLGCAFIAWWLATHFTEYCRKKKDDGGFMSNWEVGVAIGFGVGGLVTSIIALISISNLMHIWNWVAIFNPKLALAHKILGL